MKNISLFEKISALRKGLQAVEEELNATQQKAPSQRPISVKKYLQSSYASGSFKKPKKVMLKKVSVIIVFLLSSFVSHAQVNLGFALGAHYSKANTAPMSKLSLSGQVGSVIAETALYVGLTRSVEPGILAGGTVGYDLNGFIPVGGYFYNLKSNDNKELNAWLYGGGLRWKKLVGPNGGGLSAEVMYLSNNNITACFGMTFQF